MIRITRPDRAILLPISAALAVAAGVTALVNAATSDARTALGCGATAFSIVVTVLALAGVDA